MMAMGLGALLRFFPGFASTMLQNLDCIECCNPRPIRPFRPLFRNIVIGKGRLGRLGRATPSSSVAGTLDGAVQGLC